MTSSPSSTPPGTGQITRCSACGSRLRPEESWCSLCHHRVADDVPPAVPAAAAGPGAELDPVGPVDPVGPGDPADASIPVAPTRPADPAVLAQAEQLLAVLAATEAEHGRDSRFSVLQNWVGSRGGGAIVAAAGGVLLLIVGMLGLTLLGVLL
jgi:hypothetical protein